MIAVYSYEGPCHCVTATHLCILPTYLMEVYIWLLGVASWLKYCHVLTAESKLSEKGFCYQFYVIFLSLILDGKETQRQAKKRNKRREKTKKERKS